MSKKNEEYITVDGSTYEKLSSKSQTVRLAVRADILNALDILIEQGKYLSRGDAIRHILRSQMEKHDKEYKKAASKKTSKKPKQPKGPKKPSNPPRQPQRPPQRMPQRRGR
jgi:Arc/MetJ-type ribon-helix-helix transcriptional regulator